jgi:hypothetical protein
MKIRWCCVTLGTVLAAGVVAWGTQDRMPALWDVGGGGLFDRTDKAYAIDDAGAVVADLRRGTPVCPTGLGHLVSGRSSVKEIRLLFDCPAAGDYWFHVQWTPGGSGSEQFAVVQDGQEVGRGTLVDAAERPNETVDDGFQLHLPAGPCEVALVHLSGDGLHFRNLSLGRGPTAPLAVNPTLEFATLVAYEGEIKQPGVMLDSPTVRLFAPKARQREAEIIFDCLVKAYDALRRTVGADTRYRIVVYHFPESSSHFSGGTSNCTIRYGFANLDLSADPEWKAHRVPHVSGYIEEMAHNFVDATGAQFGWEMVGWSISVEVTQQVADNPTFQAALRVTRAGQERTFRRYVQGGYVFPSDLPGNQCDRIHAWLLHQCQKAYGENFWKDFFAQVRSRQADLARAKDRDERYRITIACFDRLEGMHFISRLKDLRISTTTDVKSLDPESPTWDRRLLPASQR